MAANPTVALGTPTLNRHLNKLAQGLANDAVAIDAGATADIFFGADASTDYTPKKYLGSDVLVSAGVTATPTELNAIAAAGRTPVSLTATGAITAALHRGRPLLMGAAGSALTFTLPAATGSGDRYLFVVSVVNTSNYLIKASAGTMLFKGMIIGQSVTDSATDAPRTWVPGSTDDTITLNGTTTGGTAIGNHIEFIDCSATQWMIRGFVTQSGAEATMFSDTVA